MKKFKFYLLAAVAIVAAVACKKEPEPEPDPVLTITDAKGTAVTKVSFKAEGEAATLTLKSNVDWSAKGPDWVTVAPASGNGDASVKLTAAANEAEAARNGEVVFTYSEKTLKVAVSQAAKDVVVPPTPTFEGKINSAEDFATWMALENPMDATLEADITLPETFVPDTLKGVFDGQGHTITYNLNLPENATVNGGLFSFVDGTVKNLKVAGSINTLALYNGGIAGASAENAIFENCENNVNILFNAYGEVATPHLGGIIANAGLDNKFINCVNKGKVEYHVEARDKGRSTQIGGIAAYALSKVLMRNCVNEGELVYYAKGSSRIGGMIGYPDNIDDDLLMNFENCENKGHILADVVNPASGYQYMGGLTGYYATNYKDASSTAMLVPNKTFKAVYTNCKNSGKVEVIGISTAKGQGRLGGIASYAGTTDAKMTAGGYSEGCMVYEFHNCENTGEIVTDGTIANNITGGICGFAETSAKIVIDGCKSSGALIQGATSVGSVGGLLGAKGSTTCEFTGNVIPKDLTLTAGEKGIFGLICANNAAYTTAATGTVDEAKIVKGEATTTVAFNNYDGFLFGKALGEGASISGVEWIGPKNPTIKDFAIEYVKILETWDNTTGTIDYVKSSENDIDPASTTLVENAHFIPTGTTITVGDKEYNTADMLETALRSFLLLRGFDGLETEKNGFGNIPAATPVSMSKTDVPPTHSYFFGSLPFAEPSNGGYLCKLDGDDKIYHKVEMKILDNWAQRSINFQHGQSITNMCTYPRADHNITDYSGCFSSHRALITFAFFFKYMLDHNLDKADGLASDLWIRSELFGVEQNVIAPMAGEGTEANPFIVRNSSHMTEITEKLVVGEYKYVKLERDIDMGDIVGWVPIHEANDAAGIHFDGNNKTISNFTVIKPDAANCTNKYMSLFGILHGSVKNLTVKDPVLEYNLSTPIGIIAGWAGNSNASCQAEIENVHVINGKVTSHQVSGNLGGLVGSAHATSLKNCSFDGIVIRDIEKDEDNTYRYTGGLVGCFPTAGDYLNTVDDCYTTGKIIAKVGRAVGGLFAGENAKCRIKVNNCWSTMDIEARHNVVGGLVGYWGGGEFNNCHYSGKIEHTYSADSYVGGIVAHSNYEIICKNCWTEGSITTSGQIVGGIAGQSNAVADGPTTGIVIDQCWSTMTITSGGGNVGGIVGRSSNNHPASITNCWYSGTMTSSGASKAYWGGIIGDLPKDGTITNCWVEAQISTGFAFGGIAGRMCGRGGSSADQTANVNSTATGNIFFGSLTTNTADGESTENHYSGGVIVGFSNTPNVLKNNWRGANTQFHYFADAAEDALFDQEDSDPEHPLADGKDHTAAAYTYYRPYHGKAAAADATISSLAKTIGWDETIWDLSGNKPALKNTKKQ